jgi:hypothetical protein
MALPLSPRRRWAALLAGAAAVWLALVIWHQREPPGRVYQLRLNNWPGVPVGVTRDDLAEVLRLADAADESGVNRMVAAGRAFLVEDGGRVRVIERPAWPWSPEGVRVAVLGELDAGREG